MGLFIVCSVAGVIFLPCLIPFFIRLIHSVVQGMQIAAMPIDPKHASENNKLSKILNLREGEQENKAAEVLAELEKQIKDDGVVYRINQEVVQGEWDRNKELEED